MLRGHRDVGSYEPVHVRVLKPACRCVARCVDSLGRRFGGPGAVIRAAHRAAESDESDESAVLRLGSLVEGAPRAGRAALRYFADQRDEFERDRAYRLLEAALTAEPVSPIREKHRELFGEEERLGRLPLVDAFAVLAARKPELREVATSAAASAGSEPTAVEAKQQSEERRRVSSMLLDDVDSDGGVCRSGLARSIVAQYLEILEGSDDSDPSRAYFALPRKRVVLVSRLDS